MCVCVYVQLCTLSHTQTQTQWSAYSLFCSSSRIREVTPRSQTFVLHIDQNVPLGNERSEGIKLNQRQILNMLGVHLHPPTPPLPLTTLITINTAGHTAKPQRPYEGAVIWCKLH